MRGARIIAAVLLLAGCRRESLMHAAADLSVQPASLDFGSVYRQASASRDVLVTNRGQSSDTVTVALGDGPFSTSVTQASVGGGATLTLHVLFAPTTAGAVSKTMHLSWTGGAADVALEGVGLEWLSCGDNDPCNTRAFDPAKGQCVSTPLADGTACASADQCLVSSVCVLGVCVGQARDCDDGDQCTLDSCSATAGCVHTASGQQCTGDNPCQAYACDPLLGCVGSPVADGTLCHSGKQCVAQGACVQGQCVETNQPDGTACSLDWAPCVADATCTQGVCDSPTAEALTPGTTLWTFANGTGERDFHDTYIVGVDPQGTSYLADWDTDTLTAVDVCGGVKWEIALLGPPYGGMISGEQLLLQENGVFSALALADGHRNWTVDDTQLFGFCPDGGSCGYGLNASLLFAAPAMSNDGQVFLSASSSGPPWQLELLSLQTNGHVDWLKQPGLMLQYTTEAPQVVDARGNLYAYVMDKLWSFDWTGQPRFDVGSFAQKTLSVGPGFVLDMGANPSTAWSLGGAASFSLSAGQPQFDSSAVIDSVGGVTYWPGFAVTSSPGFVRAAADGGTTATITVQSSWALTELALDDADRVYAAGVFDNNDLRLWCWDGSSHSLALDVDLGPADDDGGSGIALNEMLFVSHGLALVDVGNVLHAVFIGKHGEAKRAWWPRGIGGGNDNRHSPPPGL